MNARALMTALPLLCGCLLPTTTTTTTITGGGEVTDGAFRLYWNLGEQWDAGACYSMDLLYDGPGLSEWQANITLDADVDTWTFLDGMLNETGDDQLQWSPSDDTIGTDGWLGTAGYCSEPAAAPTTLNVWAIEDDPDDPDSNDTFAATTLEDSSGRTWITIEDAGDQGDGDCMAIEVVNLSGGLLQGWRLDLSMDRATEITETFNAYALAEGKLISIRPDTASALDTYESWEGWLCVAPFSQPTGATLTTDQDQPAAE